MVVRFELDSRELLFEGNSAIQGRATYSFSAAILLRNVTVTRNRASYGGALYAQLSSTHVVESTIGENSKRRGGAINNSLLYNIHFSEAF